MLRKYLIIVCILSSFYANAQIPQFVKLPSDYRSQKVVSTYESETAYFFNVSVVSQKTNLYYNKNIIYKTSKDGNILDSLVLTPSNDDSAFYFNNFYKINNQTFALYGIIGDYDTINDFYNYFEFRTYFIDTNLNITYVNSVPDTTNTDLFQYIEDMSKINGHIYMFMLTHNTPSSSYTKVGVLDSLGNYLYEKDIVDTLGYHANISSISKHPDNNQLILGPTISGRDVVVTDSNLNYNRTLIVNYSFPTFANSYGIRLTRFNDNQFLLLNSFRGSVLTSPMGKDSMCISKIDSNGICIKRKCIEPNNLQGAWGSGCNFTTESNYNSYKNLNNIYFGGNVSGPNLTNAMIQISNVDSNLNVRWTKFLENFGEYYAYKFVPTDDGNCLIVGYYYDTSIHKAPLVIKIDSTGVITSLFNFSNNINHQVLVYPNPSTNEISFVVSNQLDKATATIYSSTGQILKTFKVHKGENIQSISSLPIGTYFYEIVNKKGEKASGKFSKN